MKRFLLLLLTAWTLNASAQIYNNEWIDYSKTYYKFKLANSGLYRISQATISSAGLGTTNADHFQLWRNGVQIPIYTSVKNAPLGPSDYIDFYGEMNDGKADKPLYREPDFQMSEFKSLETDSATYFLTVNMIGNNFRFITAANNTAANTLPPEPYFMTTVGRYGDRIAPGRAELVGTSYTYSSSYDYGEGWASNDLANGGTWTFSAGNLLPYTGPGAPDASVKIYASGNAVNPRYVRVKLNGDSIYGQEMDYYDYMKITQNVPVSKIAAGNVTVDVNNMCALPNDRVAIAMGEVTYPRKFDFTGLGIFPFTLPANLAGNYLEIYNFTFNGPPIVMYDLTNGKRYEVDPFTLPVRKIALDPSAVDRRLVFVNEAIITQVTGFIERKFVDYSLAANQGDYLMLINSLMPGSTTGRDVIGEYQSYRSSAVGGSYNAKLYLLDQLEDQFAFGIRYHPLSIRNFVSYARNTYSNPVKSVLLIGKGITYDITNNQRSNVNLPKLNIIPTFGNPASDNLLMAEGSSSQPLTPVGRISVINQDELAIYFSKVKEYEQALNFSSPNIADKSWMKNIVHVVGAGDNNTSNLLTASLDGHKLIIQDSLYGGNVHTFSKTSADAVQQVSSIRLEALFSEGLGILTYFGHSSSSALEYNLDDPQHYNNPGKYPVFIVMGCNAGSMYGLNPARLQIKETISEKFNLAPDRGSIAFLASTHLGIIHYLDIYNTKNYQSISRRKYGATLGEITQDAIQQVFTLTTENDFYARFQCEQFTLHGDPALKFYNFAKPDYAIEEKLVKVTPAFIPVSSSEFHVGASFVNLGRASDKNIVVEVKRTYPNTTTPVVIHRDTIPFSKFQDSLSYNMDIVGSRDQGLNKITITLDPDNDIDELYETNNSITKEFYIIEDDVWPIYPYDLSIVSQQDTKLIASSANPFATNREYWMEIDTTTSFNSPTKVRRTINAPGGILEFNPGISFQDSTVYYWRVSPAVTATEPIWNNSSFQYINNSSPGFSQAHYFQHLESKANKVTLDSARRWDFDSITNNLFIKNGVWGSAITTTGELVVNINDSSYIRSACGFGFVFNVVDQKTFIPWRNQVVAGVGLYGSNYPGCAASRIWNFEYPNTAVGRNKAQAFLKMIPEGNFIVVRFVMANGAINDFAPQWALDEVTYGAGNSMYFELKNQGFSLIDSMTRPRAFSFVYKKNRSTEHAPEFVLSNGIFDPINLSVNCISPGSIGYITSPKVGPAKAWQELHWNGTDLGAVNSDKPFIDLFGIDEAGNETQVMAGISLAQQDLDISTIDAHQYPYLRMRMRNLDTTDFSPYQLRYWILNYIAPPEGAIAPNLYFTSRDTVEVGEPFNFGLAFKNVSKVDFDSVKVKMTITNKDNVETTQFNNYLKPLVVGDTVKFNIPVETGALSGHNTIFVNFNPERDQPEQYLNNNYAFRNLYVRPDSLNPLMDVTFDGVHILNKDIVAAKPAIIVEMKDEAKWMLLDDTSLLTVQVRYPDSHLRRFYFSNDTLQFIPAASGSSLNTAKINFNPYFLEDGDYELLVSGKDRSGNTAGRIQYKIGFKVINKPMISNILNYPNPFTTSTAFVFTITGSEVPQNIRIQVMTITGKIVRDITKEELGPLHIGRNITEFKWDGTDQYGQKLANGIYLYRVITNLNGKQLDKYKAQGDNTDKYFNKGYGKMYLMR